MIAEVRLQQYRSYLDKKFQFSPGVNIIVGPNASGKTNLLEAVEVICKGGSYRASDIDLIMHSKNWSRIDATGSFGNRTLKLHDNTQLKKEFILDDKTYKRLRINQQIPIVLFEPNNLLMLSGSPELRRNYLDGILELTKIGYKQTKNNYIKTLKQRNALLKRGKTTTSELFPWNVRLSHLGGYIAASRVELVTDLNKNISGVYTALSSSKDNISLSYKTSLDVESYESSLLKKLETSLQLDLIKGFTTYGPHRDDLEILINNHSPSVVASRGENRTITISLKTLETDILNKELGKKPIVLMDDVFSELDKERSKQLSLFMTGYQSIITTTDMHSVPRLKNIKSIKISN